jgi:hypothetical protein
MPAGLTVFNWSSVPNATSYNYIIAVDSLFANQIYSENNYTGTSKSFTWFAKGYTYYWKVKAKNTGGEGPWSGIFSVKLTDPAPNNSLTAPALILPQNNTTGVSTSPQFTWNSVPTATQYEIRAAKDAAYSNIVYSNTSVAGTSVTANNLVQGTTYFWSVRAKNASVQSPWSTNSSFTTGNSSNSNPLNIPQIIAPTNGNNNAPNPVVLQWSAVANATGYDYAVADDSLFANGIYNESNYQGTSKSFSWFTKNFTYYWRVRAEGNGTLSAWSAVYTFQVGSESTGGSGGGTGGGTGGSGGGGNQTLSAPVLISPLNGSPKTNSTVMFSWNSVAGATQYELKVATDQLFTNPVYDNQALAGTTATVSNLVVGQTYYWEVMAKSSTLQSLWSTIWNFTTGFNINPNPLVSNPPVTSHPRLWITQNDLPRLRNWAVQSNPMYNALVTDLNAAINTYNTKFFPGGQPNPVWPDNGTTNWELYVTEQYAEFFAFFSVIDPNPANRILHAQRARNLLMHVMNEAVKGTLAGAPFRDPGFAIYNRANYWSEAFSLTVDWIYNAMDAGNNPILTVQDKTTIRNVFLIWANACLSAATAGNEHPQPVGVMNDPQLLNNKMQLRWAANNYFTGHMRQLTMMSICMDPADDPPLNSTQPASQLGNTVRSYLTDAVGAWLYQQYSLYETSQTVINSYGLPANTTGLGITSGGLSAEGFLYGASIGSLHEALLALYTAGYTDSTLLGPQINLINSNYWNKYLDGFLHSITPTNKINPAESYLGPLFQMASYGDILRSWITPEFIGTFASLGIYDQLTNNQSRVDKERWIAKNVLEGGSANLYNRATNIWGNSYATYAIQYYLLFDPAAASTQDPRPAMPLDFYDPSLNRILSHSDWTTNQSWFDYICHWTTINHQEGDDNQFEFFRKGEWLVKEKSGYSNDGAGYTSEYHNTLGIQNDVPANLAWFEVEASARGGQWSNGMNAGDPAVIKSFRNNFVYATGDATNLYNRPNQWTPANSATDILHASRSIVWLKPDIIAVYDRAQTKTVNRFKRFFLNLLSQPQVNGNIITTTTPGGQKLNITALLPVNKSVSSNPATYNSIADYEPASFTLKIQDPSNPTNARFLNVLEGIDANQSADSAVYFKNDAGTPFEGAIIKNTAVLFMVDMYSSFTTLTFTVPSAVSTYYVTGLIPNSGYNITTASNGNNIQVTIIPGSSITADAGGVLEIDNGISKSVAVAAESGVPYKFELNQNYPNPFNPSTVISYQIADNSFVTLKVYNTLGQEIKTLVNGYKNKGVYSLSFDGTNLASGIYFYQLRASDPSGKAGNFTSIKKMIMIK